MDEALLRSVNRQLRTIKWLMGFLFLMLIASLAVLGYIAYRVVTFTQQVNTKIDNFETKTSQNLDLRNQICANKSITQFLGSDSDVCK